MKTFAFYGRVSSEDAQDPSLSIPRQLSACEHAAAAHGGKITAWYRDIESGRKSIEKRGQGGDAWQRRVAVRREGGLPELLSAAYHGSFYAVIVESIDRLSRMTVDATRIEHDLERRDIGLFAADEPISSNATSILTRRVKQGVAEWYVRDLIERSRRGVEESVRQGWHTGGRAPYGYLLQEHRHPNPAKAREGKRKHRLILDPKRAPAVLMIFEDYILTGLGLGEIINKLNSDLIRFPPPTTDLRDDAASRKPWTRSQVRAMLHNPKYTGYNVWGRHDKRPGRPRVRPREQWVWSVAPTPPAIVSKSLFDQIDVRPQRNAAATNETPATYPARRGRRPGRFYVLRGRVLCALCGRRMEGTHQKGSNRCRVSSTRGDSARRISEHPGALQIKESTLLEAAIEFMDRRLFRPDRLQDQLARSTTTQTDEHTKLISQLNAELQDIDKSQRRQSLRLEEHHDPRHPVVTLAKERIVELSTRRQEIETSIRAIEALQTSTAAQDHEIEAALDAIPDLRARVRSATTEELAEIFENFDLVITYDKPKQSLKLTAALHIERRTGLKETRPSKGRSGKSPGSGGLQRSHR